MQKKFYDCGSIAQQLRNRLDEIAKENNFEVSFEMKNVKKSGARNLNYQYVILIFTNPVGICQGWGAKEDIAEKEGLLNALEFLYSIAQL